MTRSLRKIHFFVWRFLLIAFPLGIFLALILRPDQTIESFSSSDFEINATTLNDSTQLIHIEVKNPLRYPSCIVIGIDLDKQLVLGSVSKKGNYDFKTLPSINRIILVDKLKGVDILNFSLKKP